MKIQIQKKHQQRTQDHQNSTAISTSWQLGAWSRDKQIIRIRHGLDTHGAPLVRRRTPLLRSIKHPQCVLRIQDLSEIMRQGIY